MTMPPDSPPPAVPPAARIVGTFGYRIEGDTAGLNAEIHWSAAAADHIGWRLQLWARPLGAAAPAVMVADVPLSVPLHSHGEPQQLAEGHVMALPPAGGGQHEMTLRLVSTGSDGQPLLHDEAAFGQPERFVQPRLESVSLHGGVGSVAGDGLALVVGRVHNPRPADNFSGSLSLELWALAEPYRGGPFVGRCIASARIEPLAGQSESGPLVMPVPATAADRQRPWSLMLREWTAVGYVTRDHATLVPPLPAQPPAQPPARAPAPSPSQAAMQAPAKPAAAGARPLPTVSMRTALPGGANAAPASGLGSRLMANLRQFLHRG